MKIVVQVMIALILSQLGLCQGFQAQCNDYCYLKQSYDGKCTICYVDCEESSLSWFLSCSIVNVGESVEESLTQSVCKEKCYPQGYSLTKPQQESDSTMFQQQASQIMSLQQLQGIKRENEGYIPQSQRLIKAILMMISCSIGIILIFTMIMKEIHKRQKIRQLQLIKRQKQLLWVKDMSMNDSEIRLSGFDNDGGQIDCGNIDKIEVDRNGQRILTNIKKKSDNQQ